MYQEFKTKDKMLGFIQRLGFEAIIESKIEIGKKGKIWWVKYHKKTIDNEGEIMYNILVKERGNQIC